MSKWSLNAKIYLVLSVFIIASVVISFIGLSKMSGIKDSMNSIVNESSVRIALANNLKILFMGQLLNEKNVIIDESAGGMQKQIERAAELNVEFLKVTEKAKEDFSERGKKELEVILTNYKQWQVTFEEIKELGTKNLNKEAAVISLTKSRELRVNIEAVLDTIINRNQKTMNEQIKAADADYAQATWIVLLTATLSILAGLGLASVVLRSLSKSIGEVISNLTDSSQQVTSAAQQIATSSEELSSAATEQASSLEETSSSIEEMNSMVQKNAESAKRTSELALSSSTSAEKGKQVVLDMIHAIGDISASNTSIQHQIDESNNEIAEIVKVIAEIGNKTKVINDIVFQTKLLSFNASVEAARAGDNGKGFAVVAEEVGNLAQMSGNAAKEITAMLDSSIKKVEDIVNNTKLKVGHLIQDGKTKVESGNQIAKTCGTVLDEIVSNVANVTLMANEIATACHEQSIGVQEITKAMNQLDQVTQTNAATSEESASAAEELSSQAESLQSAVGVLVVTIKGDSAKASFEHTKRPPMTQQRTVAANNVVAFNKKPKAAPVKHSAPMKKAVGFEVGKIPSENDPRFEDV